MRCDAFVYQTVEGEGNLQTLQDNVVFVVCTHFFQKTFDDEQDECVVFQLKLTHDLRAIGRLERRRM